MPTSPHEGQIYFSLDTLRDVGTLVRLLSSSLSSRKAGRKLLSADLGTIERAKPKIAELERGIDWAAEQLAIAQDQDQSRRLYVEARFRLDYQDPADVNELHLKIIRHVISGRWSQKFRETVLNEMRTVARSNQIVSLAEWRPRRDD